MSVPMSVVALLFVLMCLALGVTVGLLLMLWLDGGDVHPYP